MAQAWKAFLETPGYYNHSPWFPNPIVCMRDMTARGVVEFVDRLPWNGTEIWLEETRKNIETTVFLDIHLISLLVIIAMLFTLVRAVLDSVLLKRIPEWFSLSEDGKTKFPESAWKLMVYGCLWIGILTIVLSKDGEYFFNLESHWIGWHPGLPVETAMYWVFMLEMGFYLHGIYATIYLETRRKDFSVMLTHHFITFGLLLFSYAVRMHVVGIMLLCLIDIGDILLELGKCMVYFKDRNGTHYFWPELAANIVFGAFATQFFVCRVYWMLTKILYSVTYVGPTWYGMGAPWYMLLVPMIWVIYLMQIYWFRLILLTIHKVFIKGQVIEDNREETKHKSD